MQDYNLTFFKRVSSWELRGNLHHGPQSRRVKATAIGLNLRPAYLKFRPGVWADLVYPFPAPADLRDATVSLYCHLRADAAVKLRISALTLKDDLQSFSFAQSDIAGVAHVEVELEPGYAVVDLPFDDFTVLYGAPRPDRASGLIVGGESPVRANLECVCALHEKDDASPRARQLSPVGNATRHLSRFRDVARNDGLAFALTKVAEKIGKRLARKGV